MLYHWSHVLRGCGCSVTYSPESKGLMSPWQRLFSLQPPPGNQGESQTYKPWNVQVATTSEVVDVMVDG